MIPQPPRSTRVRSSAASDVYKRQIPNWIRNDKTGMPLDQMADELGMSSDDLLSAVNDSKYVAKSYASEAQKMADKDPNYQALGNTLQTLKEGLPQKRTIASLRNKEMEAKPVEVAPAKNTTVNIDDAKTGSPISVDAFHGSGADKKQIYNCFEFPVAG